MKSVYDRVVVQEYARSFLNTQSDELSIFLHLWHNVKLPISICNSIYVIDLWWHKETYMTSSRHYSSNTHTQRYAHYG